MELLDYCARSEKLGRVTKKMSRSRVLIKTRCTGSRFACSRKRLDEPTAIIGLRFEVNFRSDTIVELTSRRKSNVNGPPRRAPLRVPGASESGSRSGQRNLGDLY